MSTFEEDFKEFMRTSYAFRGAEGTMLYTQAELAFMAGYASATKKYIAVTVERLDKLHPSVR